jgi:hypothetical protein
MSDGVTGERDCFSATISSMKHLLNALTLVGGLAGMIAFYFLFVPRVMIREPQVPDYGDPFEIPFVVANEGNFAIFDVHCECRIDAEGDRTEGRLKGNVPYSRVTIAKIGAGEEVAYYCRPDKRFDAFKPYTNVHFAIHVRYRPRLLRWRRSTDKAVALEMLEGGHRRWDIEPR